MSDHFVRHMLRDPGDVYTEYLCRAPADAPCRTWCKTCEGECREQCECEYEEPPREPNLVGGNPCNIVYWLTEDASDECWSGGNDEPVRGPDWQPIKTIWNGDNFEWEYEEIAQGGVR
jgi:hypothetical protein